MVFGVKIWIGPRKKDNYIFIINKILNEYILNK